MSDRPWQTRGVAKWWGTWVYFDLVSKREHTEYKVFGVNFVVCIYVLRAALAAVMSLFIASRLRLALSSFRDGWGASGTSGT